MNSEVIDKPIQIINSENIEKSTEFVYRSPDEMKDSGVEWIGLIPKDWDRTHLKNLVKIKITDGPHETPIFIDEGVPFLSAEAIVDSKVSMKNLRGYISQEQYDIYAKKSKVLKNDILFCKSGSTTGKSAFVETDELFGIWSPLAIIRANNKVKNRFLFHFIQSNLFRRQVENFWSFGTQPNIGMGTLENLWIAFSINFQEQEKIASFLDKKTTEFDNIIEKKEKIINKLEEAKKSLISEAVTGKIKIVSDSEFVYRSPDEMKDSGVEWIGLIPNDWKTSRIKYLFQLRNERNSEEMHNVQILSLYTSLGVKKSDDIEEKTGNKVRTVEDYKIVYPKDIVVNIILAWMGSIGMSNYNGVISPAYDIYKPLNNVHSNYYNYLFRTNKFSGECFKYGRGIMLMRWRTYSDEFKSIWATFPPLQEQEKIASFLDRKTNEFDTIISKEKRMIEKIKEAKQSLISETVTGKIKVI